MSQNNDESSSSSAGSIEQVDCSLNVHALTDKGNVRDHNEDAFTVLTSRGLLIVSDGMGGQNAGSIASQLVVELLPDMIEQAISSLGSPDGGSITDAIRDTITGLSQEIRERSKGRPGLAGMGATVVMALSKGSEAIIGHMGDSRAYLFRNGELQLLTDDHSVVGILLRSGEISPEDAAKHPARGVLSRYMGMEDAVYPDLKSVPLEIGDRLLLCTDGLTDELTDEEIAYILCRHSDPAEACAAFIETAKAGEAKDNITVVLGEWSEEGKDEMELVSAEEGSSADNTD